MERAEVVQVSSSEDSPNITKVTGNVTVIIYKCTDVTYCGPAFVGDRSATYTFTSATIDPIYFPSSSPTLLSANAYYNGLTGLAMTPAGTSTSLADWHTFGTSTSTSVTYGLYTGTTSGDALTTIKPYKPYNSDQISGLVLPTGDGSKTTSDLFQHLVAMPVTSSYQISDISFSSSAGNEGKPWGQNETTWKPVTGYLPTSYEPSSNSMDILKVSATSLSYLPGENPLVDEKQDGALSGYWQNLKVASYSNPQPNFGTTANIGIHFDQPPTNFATGSDKDSLIQELQNLSETNKKVVGWTIMTEDDHTSQ